jgi:hypothetical protein
VSTSLRWRAGADDCEQTGKEREQSRRSIVRYFEQKAALFASRCRYHFQQQHLSIGVDHG